MFDIKKAFSIITDKVAAPLAEQGFKREKVGSSEKEMVALFTGEAVAYSVVYYIEKMIVVLRSCAMTDEGPDNEWKTMATWMFNPETDAQREAESIGNDFADTVSAASAVKRVKQAKKKKNSDDGSADPLFLAKRFVTYFPELKSEIAAEQNGYESFRGVHFMRTYVVPRVNNLLATGSKGEISKMGQMISTQYANGDMDTRSIITIVILNSVEDAYIEKFSAVLSEELQKSWKFALKMKGKKVRPEKPKKSLAAYTADKL
ncbi:MAG: hypothetical protein E7563_07960 [Ruminococcaceae bacterium]|nr:hypothetical protein [Oscillospiraceae bacterium]